MEIDFTSIAANQRYHIMTQVIVPRPIAWVLTDNGLDTPSYNLAPYSYFNAISSEPPLVILSAGSKPNGELKDTRSNLLNSENCVIHIPSLDQAEAVTDSAATLPHGESEVEKLSLSLVEQEGWALPRLADCKVAMACRLYDVTEIGPLKQALIFCEIEKVYVDDQVVELDAKGRTRVNAAALSPLSRLGGGEYAALGEILSISRPA